MIETIRQDLNKGIFEKYSGTNGDFYYLHLLFNILFFYFRLYGIHFIFITFLTCMTLFRKDISCNRVYSRNERYCIILGKTLRVQDTERILDGSSYAFCGGPWLLSIVDNLLFPVMKRLCYCGYSMVPSIEDYNAYIPFANDYDSYDTLAMVRKCHLTEVLPVDTQIHVLSFLDIKDIISFSMTNKYTHELIHGNNNTADHLQHSNLVWKTLISRDFAHILTSKYMQIAINRHSTTLTSFHTREFYFEFQCSWLNYILAGHNTQESCLVGIHGNALDITDFIEHHPGSPETILMHSGIDATRYFTTLNHSKRAQSIAHHKIVLNKPGCGTLLKYHDWYKRECMKRETYQYCFKDVVGNVHVYYDAVECCWRGWYTSNQDFLPVFVDKI